VYLLANDFFFATRDAMSGRPRVSGRTAALGLAGAMLGELVLWRRITIERGQITVVDRHPPNDPMAATVLSQVIVDNDVAAARDWLRYMAQTANDVVAKRLLLAGLVRPRTPRRPWRSTIYLPNDPNLAVIATARLATRLAKHEPLTIPDTVLLGLMMATGLERHVLVDAPADTGRYLHHVLATTLPPPLAELISETEASVGDAVLSHRS
jgi:hypothetical protein